mgnify:CR=1 FL=1
MHCFKKKKSPPPSFVTESGDFDVKKLFATNPDTLSRFMHKKEGDDKGEGEGAGTDRVAMPIALGMAALRQAQELSASYAPAKASDVVQQMALSAQYNLGIEAAHGLQMNAGGAGTTPTPYGPRSEDDDGDVKKKKKSEE